MERHVEVRLQKRRERAHQGHVQRAAEREAHDDAIDVVGRALAGANARDERVLLLQVVGDLHRLERDRRVEEGRRRRSAARRR